MRDLPEDEASDTARFLENFKPFSPRRVDALSSRAKLLLTGAALLVSIIAGFLFYRSAHTRQATCGALAEDSGLRIYCPHPRRETYFALLAVQLFIFFIID